MCFNAYDVMTWERFPLYCIIVNGLHRSLVDSPYKGIYVELLVIWDDVYIPF